MIRVTVFAVLSRVTATMSTYCCPFVYAARAYKSRIESSDLVYRFSIPHDSQVIILRSKVKVVSLLRTLAQNSHNWQPCDHKVLKLGANIVCANCHV